MAHEITHLPLEITESGTYQLSQSMEVPQGDFAIKISAPDVRLDLGGFTLNSQTSVAILLAAPKFQLFRGTVWATQIAIAPLPHVRADQCRFHDLTVKGGIFVGGDHAVVENCTIDGGTYGLKVGRHCLVKDTRITNSHVGLEVGAGSRVERCDIRNCEDGVYAYGSNDEASHLEQVVVYDCKALGLRLDGPGTLKRCEAHNNGQGEPAGGILAGPAASVNDCEAYGNQGGDISIVEPCELARNRTSDGSG